MACDLPPLNVNEHLFTSYRHAGDIIENWQADYNARRPHTSLNGLTPVEFATRSAPDHKEIPLTYRRGQKGVHGTSYNQSEGRCHPTRTAHPLMPSELLGECPAPWC